MCNPPNGARVVRVSIAVRRRIKDLYVSRQTIALFSCRKYSARHFTKEYNNNNNNNNHHREPFCTDLTFSISLITVFPSRCGKSRNICCTSRGRSLSAYETVFYRRLIPALPRARHRESWLSVESGEWHAFVWTAKEYDYWVFTIRAALTISRVVRRTSAWVCCASVHKVFSVCGGRRKPWWKVNWSGPEWIQFLKGL